MNVWFILHFLLNVEFYSECVCSILGLIKNREIAVSCGIQPIYCQFNPS